MSGKLVVISGPSGAGKTSVCRALKQLPGVEFSVSATTRSPRPGEQPGVDYHFLARDEFERRARAGEFLEWAEYNGRFYGTPRAPMDRAVADGRVFLLEIEVAGTRQLREQDVPGIYVFIAPPSIGELRARLERRGTNSADDIAARVRIAEAEIAAAGQPCNGRPLYEHTIVNSDLDATIRRVADLIGVPV
ncbi:MAG: guanylate kinase [Planctomycetota bacterium]